MARTAGDGQALPQRDALLSLQQQSMELGRVALQGSRDPKPQPKVCPLLILKQLEGMKQQKRALENRIRAGEVSTEDLSQENLTKEYMTEAIATLEKEIDKLKVSFQNKSLVIRRMQLYDALHRKLLEKSPESKLIYETMEHSMDLSSHILTSQKETLALEEKLTEVRKKRLEIKQTCTSLMTELNTLKDTANRNIAQLDNQNLRRINKYIAKEIDIVTVIQNVFQRLILGSRINWAEDPKLKEIVLELGKNPA